MADTSAIKTRPITRDKLALFLPTHELIKAFENLSQDVAETIPDAIEGVATSADSVLAAVAFARPPATLPPLDGGASQILASQIFGA